MSQALHVLWSTFGSGPLAAGTPLGINTTDGWIVRVGAETIERAGLTTRKSCPGT
jgi:hypothetical protein